ncbi:hypothetical protein [Streptomyces sp. NPDC002328]|uniref:hypothetical protein n=1 Tax=Streptomyces sp. NPDC002328 TaxID=3364642 RepID=UPI0036795B70
MRAQPPVRRIASSALCAALVLGIAAPTALAVDGDATRERAAAASRTPVPGADALVGQVEGLGDLGAVLTPVTDLLGTGLTAEGGQLTADQANRLGDAVREALAKINATTAATPASLTTPAADMAPSTDAAVTPSGEAATVPSTDAAAVPAPAGEAAAPAADAAVSGTDAGTSAASAGSAASVAPATDAAAPVADAAVPVVPAAPAADTAAVPAAGAATAVPPVGLLRALAPSGDATVQGRAVRAKAADAKADALADLQQALDALLAAVTSGNAEQVLPAATDVVTGLVDLVAATLEDGGLTAPALAALPELPAVPELDLPAALQAAPAAPENAATSENTAASENAAAPATPALPPALPAAPPALPTEGLSPAA